MSTHPPPVRTSHRAPARPSPLTVVRDLARRRPLTAFFALAFGLSWLAWTPFVLSRSGLGVVDWDFPAVLGTTQLLGMLPGAYLGPITAAFVVTAASEGREGLRRWAHRLTHWRVGWRWYAAVLVSVPAVVVAATLVLPSASAGARLPSPVVLLAYLPVLAVQFFTTALAEEPGWRDFALPRLQRRNGPLAGTVVLGVLWGVWHLPLFLTVWGGWPDLSWVQPVEFVALCVPLSIVITWVFNRTAQSVPLVMVLHASINTVYSAVWFDVFPQLDFDADTTHSLLIASFAAAVVLVVATRGRLGLQAQDPETGTAPTRPVAERVTAA